MSFEYDIIVVGAGHAGCEAASAAARMGSKTLLITMDMNKIAQMSCNPAVGGIAKGRSYCHSVPDAQSREGSCNVEPTQPKRPKAVYRRMGECIVAHGQSVYLAGCCDKFDCKRKQGVRGKDNVRY